jgi:hypothetical protein
MQIKIPAVIPQQVHMKKNLFIRSVQVQFLQRSAHQCSWCCCGTHQCSFLATILDWSSFSFTTPWLNPPIWWGCDINNRTSLCVDPIACQADWAALNTAGVATFMSIFACSCDIAIEQHRELMTTEQCNLHLPTEQLSNRLTLGICEHWLQLSG